MARMDALVPIHIYDVCLIVDKKSKILKATISEIIIATLYLFAD